MITSIRIAFHEFLHSATKSPDIPYQFACAFLEETTCLLSPWGTFQKLIEAKRSTSKQRSFSINELNLISRKDPIQISNFKFRNQNTVKKGSRVTNNGKCSSWSSAADIESVPEMWSRNRRDREQERRRRRWPAIRREDRGNRSRRRRRRCRRWDCRSDRRGTWEHSP